MALEISCRTCRYNGTGERVCGKCVNLSRYAREPELDLPDPDYGF